MYIEKLTINCFKNHDGAEFAFCDSINCLYGSNGAGKTNILDAIYFLAASRSYFSRSDQQSIPFGKAYARWEGHFVYADSEHKHTIVLPEAGKKQIERNGSVVTRLADFVVRVPIVMITPSDISLITGNSDERRRLIDRTISLTQSDYLKGLQKYNKALLSRNEMLKSFAVNRHVDKLAIEAINAQMEPLGDFIHKVRKGFLQELNEHVKQIYAALSDGAEEVRIEYNSSLVEGNTKHLLEENIQQDLYAQRTTKGVHKDDMLLTINNMEFKKYASQGQIKTMTISIHLATYRFLSASLNKTPILLLDDIYEKIDEDRANKLMTLIASENYGQIFITDTSLERMEKRLTGVTAEKKFFNIERPKDPSENSALES